jgi:hypothetical protein
MILALLMNLKEYWMTSICFYSLKDASHDIFGGVKEKKYSKEVKINIWYIIFLIWLCKIL